MPAPISLLCMQLSLWLKPFWSYGSGVRFGFIYLWRNLDFKVLLLRFFPLKRQRLPNFYQLYFSRLRIVFELSSKLWCQTRLHIEYACLITDSWRLQCPSLREHVGCKMGLLLVSSWNHILIWNKIDLSHPTPVLLNSVYVLKILFGRLFERLYQFFLQNFFLVNFFLCFV